MFVFDLQKKNARGAKPAEISKQEIEKKIILFWLLINNAYPFRFNRGICKKQRQQHLKWAR